MDIEKELLDACIKEERRAQFELYRRCYSMLMSVCLRYQKNKDDAEFMLNRVFYKILTNLHRYDPQVPFEAWIRRIAINTCIDQFRKDSRNKIQYLDEPMDVAPVTVMDYNEADKRFDAEELEMMIKKLPPVSQKVFNLYVIDGYNHREIGEKLNMSEGTSKWHLNNARTKLKALLLKIMNHVAVLL